VEYRNNNQSVLRCVLISMLLWQLPPCVAS